MYYVRTLGLMLFMMIGLLGLSACGGGLDGDIFDDLNSSSDDKRPPVEKGSSGTQVGQNTPDFTVQDTLSASYTLSTELGSASAVVLYFTMWCPTCDSHMSDIRANIVPDFPNTKFFFVDYVSGSISASRAEQISNGYTSSTVLADIDNVLENLYKGTMGTTIVIDSTGAVRMNEDYNNSRLREALNTL